MTFIAFAVSAAVAGFWTAVVGYAAVKILGTGRGHGKQREQQRVPVIAR